MSLESSWGLVNIEPSGKIVIAWCLEADPQLMFTMSKARCSSWSGR